VRLGARFDRPHHRLHRHRVTRRHESEPRNRAHNHHGDRSLWSFRFLGVSGIRVQEISVMPVTHPLFVEVSNWTWAPIGISESVVAE
jgi:hypothetical protein